MTSANGRVVAFDASGIFKAVRLGAESVVVDADVREFSAVKEHSGVESTLNTAHSPADKIDPQRVAIT